MSEKDSNDQPNPTMGGPAEEEGKIEDSNLEELFDHVKELEELRGTRIFSYLLLPMELERDLVETTYDILQQFKGVDKLDVLVASHGGDIHSAYHLGKLLRQYAKKKLSFIVPRYAKSAATLLTFAGDEIVFGPTSEIGPLDPQIALPPKEKDRFIQRFSPLAIRPTLDLIAEENEKGHKILVEKLSASLPEALLLGQHLKALEVAKHYAVQLLTTRMLKGKKNAAAIASQIGEQLVSGYPDHRYCIDYDEAASLGLNVTMAPEDQWSIIWDIWKHAQKFMEEQARAAEHQNKTRHDILDMS